jgi:tRNA threonylcarbamoyladenosine biosynthesis protein TsaE
VIVVEWGEGKVEELTDDRLSLVIHRAVGTVSSRGTTPGSPETDEVRHVTVTGLGARWAAVELGVLGG